jgi:hypothetical protein
LAKWIAEVAVARIYRNQGLGSPVLQKERFGWVMEFASERPQHADPLTGWAGGAEPLAQDRLPDQRGGHRSLRA